MMRAVRRLLKMPLRAALAWPPLRRRAAFELRHRYYHELANVIPLEYDLECPLAFPDAWCSFAEIFVLGEYQAALDDRRLPRRWIDLGCHAGFFSLYVEWRRARAGERSRGTALLVDGDRRMAAAVAELSRRNGLDGGFRFVHGAIASGAGTKPFFERDYMASSAVATGGTTAAYDVKVLTADALVAMLPPPYDLIKVDIEGSEHEFVAHYDAVIRETRSILLEWHAIHGGDPAAAEICRKLERHGFDRGRELTRPRGERARGASSETRLLLFERR